MVALGAEDVVGFLAGKLLIMNSILADEELVSTVSADSSGKGQHEVTVGVLSPQT